MSGGVLEFFVFDELADEFPARVFLLDGLLAAGGLVFGREQAAAFQVNQVRRHGDEVARAVEVGLRDGGEVVEVLADEPFQGQVVKLDLLLAHEVQKQVERTLENVQPHLVFGIGGRDGFGRGGHGMG